MAVIRGAFDRFGDMYAIWFADWLHMHFLVRTALLLLMMWFIIYVTAQLLQYVFAPLALMFGRRIANRRRLGYGEQVRRSRLAALRFMVICAAACTLWVTAFGLHQEYARPVLAPYESTFVDIFYVSYDDGTEEVGVWMHTETTETYDDGSFNPARWAPDADIIFYLNEIGAEETRLRSGPGVADYSVIEILWDNDLLVYLHYFYPDAAEEGLYWLRVMSPTGTVGYVNSHLIEKIGE